MAVLEILHADFDILSSYLMPIVREGRHDRFFDHHPQVCTGESFGLLSNGIKVTFTLNQRRDRTQDISPHGLVRHGELHDIIKASPCRFVQQGRMVGCPNEKDTILDETDHIDVFQQHIHRPLHCSVIIGETGLCNEIKLINKENTGRKTPGQLKYAVNILGCLAQILR